MNLKHNIYYFPNFVFSTRLTVNLFCAGPSKFTQLTFSFLWGIATILQIMLFIISIR